MSVAKPSPSGGARPGGNPADLTAVWTVITSMYRAFTIGDRSHVDSFLDPGATFFDSENPDLVRGKTELDRIRDRRPAPEAGPRETGFKAHDEVIDIFGDLALARYWLRVDFAALPALAVRNTAVLRRSRGLWRIIHLHEDVQHDTVPDVSAEKAGIG